jgi:hypothetical protein
MLLLLFGEDSMKKLLMAFLVLPVASSAAPDCG